MINFNDLYDSVDDYSRISDMRIEEALSPEALIHYKKAFANTDIKPHPYDITITQWIRRISNWGKLTITHDDPENKKKENVSILAFVRKVTDESLNKLLGTWDIVSLEVNRVEIIRYYVGLDGKKYKESFLIEIDLKDNLKKALK